jgi:hypothetical protein
VHRRQFRDIFIKMRIERTGGTSPIKPLIERFLIESLNGKSLDELRPAEEEKADFLCLGGLLVVEVKTLEDDASERINNLTNELSRREDWPMFIGPAPLGSYVRNLNEPEQVRQKVVDQIGKRVAKIVHKANKQLRAHARIFPRKSQVKLLLIVNENHEIYDPNHMQFILAKILMKKNKNELNYNHIDYIIYITEKHATKINGSLSFPIICMRSAASMDLTWQDSVIEKLLQKYSEWRSTPIADAEVAADSFVTIAEVPETAKRDEWWRIDYARNPYLSSLSLEELRNRFDENQVIMELAHAVDSPIELPIETRIKALEQFTHLTCEMANRATAAQNFQYDPIRIVQAASRVGLPPDVVNWFRTMNQI